MTLTSGTLIGSGFVRYGVRVGETDQPTSPNATVLWVYERFLETMETPLLLGRDFTARDFSDGPSVVLVNESFRHAFFDGGDPAGRRLEATGENMRIVGVFADTHYGNGRTGPTPMVLVASPEQLGRAWTFVVRTEGPPEVLAPMCGGSSEISGPTWPSVN